LNTLNNLKKEASLFIIELSHGLKETVGAHSNAVVKALAKNLGHQHSKVRKATIEVKVFENIFIIISH